MHAFSRYFPKYFHLVDSTLGGRACKNMTCIDGNLVPNLTMKKSGGVGIRFSLQKKFIFSIMLIIGPVLGLVFLWAGILSERNATAQIVNQARILARQIILTRQWVADCGGVMVARDSAGAKDVIFFLDDHLTTSHGRYNRFTPAMVTKKLSQYSFRENMYRFQLAGLTPMNPENRPDAFERSALLHFVHESANEIYDFENDEQTFRYTVPLYVDKACMKCHPNYTAESVGGCLSIFFPTGEFKQSLKNTYFNLAVGGVAIILLTGMTLFFLLRKMVIKPVNKIRIMTTEISNDGNRGIIHMKTGDEFEQLGRAFNIMAARVHRNHEIMKDKIAAATSELSQANRELKKVDKLKTEFIADMSHELRSPVTAVQGGLDYLKRKITEEENQTYLTIIDNNLLRLTHLISDMLELTRIKAGKITWNFEQNDIVELIREVTEILSLKAREKAIAFDFHCQDRVWAEMDSERIEQVLVNLIENAIKFSDRNSKIAIKTSLEDQWVRVSVRDFGISIPEKDLDAIFREFHTLRSGGNSGQTKGIGLGLAICRKIIEAHKGRIWAESAEGRGNVFHFAIPRERTD